MGVPAKILRAPVVETRRGGNPGFEVKRLRDRVAELEREVEALRGQVKAPRVRRAPTPAGVDVEWLKGAYMGLSPFDVETPEYQAARTAYLLAAYGTTNAKALRALSSQGIRSEPVTDAERPKAGLVEVVHELMEGM